MRKVKALIRNEITNFKRSKLARTMAILYVLGLGLSIYSVFEAERLFTLSGFIKSSWIPLNFVMIPFLIFSMNIGKSNNSVFDTIDISPREKILAKILTVEIIGVCVLIVNIIVFLVIGIICRVSIGYLLYNSLGYIINTIVFFMACGAIGLFIGQVVSKKTGDVFAFIIAIAIFITLCNFYKFRNFIAPLYYMRQFPSSFDIFNYDKSYFYHNILWLILSYMILKITFYKEYKKEKATLIKAIAALAVSFGLSIFLISNLHSSLPDFLNIGKGMWEPLGSKLMEKKESFRSEEEKKYYAYKYKMNMELDGKLKNSCEMEIKVLQDKVSSLEFGFFKKLNISKLELDGTKLDYKRTNNSLIINLPREYKNGDVVTLKIDYEGNINTVWRSNDFNGVKSSQYKQLFYVKKNLLALGGVFEWYPKQNDFREKEYSLDVKYNSKNKLYSNLDGSSSSTGWKFQGSDKEILLVSGYNIKEREYNGHLFIGNEEYINSNKFCEGLISGKNRKGEKKHFTEIKKLIHVPLDYNIKECYEKAYIYSTER